jgi:hypothetical protein
MGKWSRTSTKKPSFLITKSTDPSHPTLQTEEEDTDQAATLKPEEVHRLEEDQESIKNIPKMIRSAKTSRHKDLVRDNDNFIYNDI